jgi:hypothetical protein
MRAMRNVPTLDLRDADVAIAAMREAL